MPLGDPAGDRQSQARPFHFLRRGAKEAVEHAGLSARRKRRPRVGDFDDEATVALLDRDIDSSARRRVSNRIVDEARKQGANLIRGAPANGLGPETELQVDLFAVGQRSVIGNGLKDERIDVHALVGSSAALLEPGQMEQLVDERTGAPTAAAPTLRSASSMESAFSRASIRFIAHPTTSHARGMAISTGAAATSAAVCAISWRTTSCCAT